MGILEPGCRIGLKETSWSIFENSEDGPILSSTSSGLGSSSVGNDSGIRLRTEMP